MTYGRPEKVKIQAIANKRQDAELPKFMYPRVSRNSLLLSIIVQDNILLNLSKTFARDYESVFVMFL